MFKFAQKFIYEYVYFRNRIFLRRHLCGGFTRRYYFSQYYCQSRCSHEIRWCCSRTCFTFTSAKHYTCHTPCSTRSKYKQKTTPRHRFYKRSRTHGFAARRNFFCKSFCIGIEYSTHRSGPHASAYFSSLCTTKKRKKSRSKISIFMSDGFGWTHTNNSNRRLF